MNATITEPVAYDQHITLTIIVIQIAAKHSLTKWNFATVVTVSCDAIRYTYLTVLALSTTNKVGKLKQICHFVIFCV